MSNIGLSEEIHNLVEAFGYGWEDVRWLTINAMKSAFWPFDERLRTIEQIIKPAYLPLV
jgi:adenosine deaminase